MLHSFIFQKLDKHCIENDNDYHCFFHSLPTNHYQRIYPMVWLLQQQWPDQRAGWRYRQRWDYSWAQRRRFECCHWGWFPCKTSRNALNLHKLVKNRKIENSCGKWLSSTTYYLLIFQTIFFSIFNAFLLWKLSKTYEKCSNGAEIGKKWKNLIISTRIDVPYLFPKWTKLIQKAMLTNCLFNPLTT